MVGNAPLWGYMCLYRPDAKHTGRCGKDFLEISTAPKSIYGPFFRESGGYLEDLDGDGWEDITLIYHWMVYTISGRTGQPISLTEYDIAKATDPRYPGFHSGRNYGIHTVLTGPDGMVRTVMIGGAPVGQFGGPYAFCNVSRFVGVLASVTKAPAARKLAWSHYYGRNSTVFDLSKGYRPEQAAHPPVVRPPDIENGCIHRFSDGIATTGDARIVIFDAFRQTAPADLCTAEQYSYYAPGNDEKVWYACWDKNLKSKGTWTVQAFTLENGRSLFTQTNFYVWGMSDNFLPGREQVFLAEHLPAQQSFDLSDVTPSKLVVVTLSHGQWQMRGSFPIAGRPKIVLSYPGGPYGVDSASANRNGYADLVTRKNKESGLDEVELEDGSWVAYEQASGQFVRKTP
jgi:hypothetical protein